MRKLIMFTLGFLLSLSGILCGAEHKASPVKWNDYFPTTEGAKWTYKIEVVDTEPIKYREVLKDVGLLDYGSFVVNEQVGSFTPLLVRKDQKVFMLEMRIKGPIAQQLPFKYPHGVELTIEKDELGIFEDNKQVFWGISPFEESIIVEEVITYPPYVFADKNVIMFSTGSAKKAEPAKNDTFTKRIFFFAGKLLVANKPEAEITEIGDPEGTDMVKFNGIEAQGKQKGALLCVRIVKPKKYQDKSFTEYMWFEKGKGLVRLEQKIDGKTSMVWTLVKFLKEPK